jgi:hypothetical protein
VFASKIKIFGFELRLKNIFVLRVYPETALGFRIMKQEFTQTSVSLSREKKSAMFFQKMDSRAGTPTNLGLKWFFLRKQRMRVPRILRGRSSINSS